MVPGLCPKIDFYLHVHTFLFFKNSSVHKETCQCNGIKRPENGSGVNTRNVVYAKYTW
jgi:hypothetical protein